jgi:hypothetical protein
VGAGFLDAAAGFRGIGREVEGFARAEAGWHFAPQGSAFGFGEAALRPGAPVSWQAGVGLRVNW